MDNEHDDVPKHHKKAITSRKKFGIEIHYARQRGWFNWKWYPTAWQRDMAFDALMKSRCGLAKTEYRKVDRP